MSLGKCIHWCGILMMLGMCFWDELLGKPHNVLAANSYTVILLGFALTILGIERNRDGRPVCLLEALADCLFEEDEAGPDAPRPEGTDSGAPPCTPGD